MNFAYMTPEMLEQLADLRLDQLLGDLDAHGRQRLAELEARRAAFDAERSSRLRFSLSGEIDAL